MLLTAIRIAFAGTLVLHGVIHLAGFAKAFELAALPQLTQPITRPLGLLWLVAGVLLVVSAFIPARWFWWVGTVALFFSSIAIIVSWHDAKLGLILNGVVLLGVGYAFAAQGPVSLAAEYQRNLRSMITKSRAPLIVTEGDLVTLPAAVQRYLRVTGSIGQPRIVDFRARWKGRIRNSASDPWMPFSAEQANTFGDTPARLFSMNASMKGLPVDIYHRFIDESATFRVRVLSAFTMVNASGPVMNQSETVTVLNDLCMLAPSALLGSALRWEASDARSARVAFTRGDYTVRATLHFNDAGELVDFVSDDRSRASADGKTFTRERWSTPLSDYRAFGTRKLSSRGKALTHDPNGTFAYAEVELQSIDYNFVAASSGKSVPVHESRAGFTAWLE